MNKSNLLEFINKSFSYKNICLSSDDSSKPLTGKEINFTSVDLLSLYHLLCEEVGTKLRIRDIYSFWSVDNILIWLNKELSATTKTDEVDSLRK